MVVRDMFSLTCHNRSGDIFGVGKSCNGKNAFPYDQTPNLEGMMVSFYYPSDRIALGTPE